MTHCVIKYYLDEIDGLCAHDNKNWTFYIPSERQWALCDKELYFKLEVPRVYALLFLEEL